jgi:3-oxoacyl-ACP reductase-like protein
MEGRKVQMPASVKQPGQPQQGQQKLSYEQLENVAHQLQQQAEMWKQRAMEASQRFTRVELILNCLNMNSQYVKDKITLFDGAAVERMAQELIDTLYPAEPEAFTPQEEQVIDAIID